MIFAEKYLITGSSINVSKEYARVMFHKKSQFFLHYDIDLFSSPLFDFFFAIKIQKSGFSIKINLFLRAGRKYLWKSNFKEIKYMFMP